MTHRCGLVILAREPRAGAAKTRLAAALGAGPAAHLYGRFLCDTLARAAGVPFARVFVACAPAAEPLAAWATAACPGAEWFPQQGADLGERIAAAAAHAHARGCDRVVIIGSDAPSLPMSRVVAAARALRRADVVLGPARDGGFYLIAARALDGRLFANVRWSTPDTLRQTSVNAARLSLAVHKLPTWYDVDTADDLGFLARHLRALKARGCPIPCPATHEALRGFESRSRARIGVVIPALNEEAAIGRVLDDIPPGLADDIVVVDNGSTDRTAEVARQHGSRVICEPERGYGAACLAGIVALDHPDIVAFLDADYSDYPEEMARVVAPILDERADLVIGSRMAGHRERRALPAHSIAGNRIAALMLRCLHHQRATDLGPFRAIRADALMELGMADRAFGWTMEMQAKAARARLRVVEVPVSYRPRIGESKITGSLAGSVKAGVGITSTAIRVRWWKPDRFV